MRLPARGWLASMIVVYPAIGTAGSETGSYSLIDPVPTAQLRALSPGLTPYTVDAGHLQIEVGAASVLRDASSGPMTTTATVAALELKVGATENTDIELVLPAWVQRTSTGSSIRGVGDPAARLKINLIGNGAGGIAIGVLPHITFPVGNGLGREAATVGAAIPVAFSLPQGFGVSGSVDVYQPLASGEDSDAELAATALISHHIIGPVAGFCEWLVATTDAFDGAALTTHVGVNVSLGDDGELDTGVMVDPTDPTSRYNPYVNLIVRR
jgi:hypothetical protein